MAADDGIATAGAQSVRRALAVLRIVAAGQEQGVRLVDVAHATGLNRPTVHRILRVLVEEGAAEQDPATRRYLIGREVSLMGLARSARPPVQAAAEPHLRALAETEGETCFLTIRNGDDSVCLVRQPGSYPIKVLSIAVGARRPLGAGVSGLVLLGALPPADAAAIVLRNAPRLQALGIAPDQLLQRAAAAAAHGYAYAAVGVVPGSRAVAVPVRASDGRVLAGLAVAAITERLPDDRVQPLAACLAALATQIGAETHEAAARSSLKRRYGGGSREQSDDGPAISGL
ncbi:IclR family transcriptional regulator [uncultured Xylophilus sp.]|uniref:IclR family transcriptional regulator n=1 Tax=uncultured Xylophilus sp. TaxID=296832 RepID=UPI0025F7A81E|nr:IclR family transcriptional regulator [uncultured Xylophilus sp.]